MKNTSKIKKAIFYPFGRNRDYAPSPGIYPTVDVIPEWYKNAKKFTETEDKSPTFKSCISFFDALSIGYSFVIPSDLTVTIEDGSPKLIIEDRYKDNFQERPPMKDFAVPEGYDEKHFAFIPDWAIQLPKGYSALYVNPLNRFDLPFLMTNGVIENDEFLSPGAMPFFIKKGFSGTIKSGTPIAQFIPFKREEWTSEVRPLSSETMNMVMSVNTQDLRGKKSGGYRDKYWTRKIFK